MSHIKDLTGQRFGTLVVIRKVESTEKGLARWLCKCDCGNEHIATGQGLRRGNTKSCGANIHKRGQNMRDLTGRRFGRLTVIERAEGDKPGIVKWKCQCDCGNIKDINAYSLTTGRSTSCGCYIAEKAHEINKTHGMSKTRLYNTWNCIKGRCYDKKNVSYKSYGGRGITMCDEWRYNAEAFMNWALENGYDDTLTIDRIDPNGNYEPSNCRWATVLEQANNKRNTRRITYNGVTHTITEWANITGVKRKSLYWKLITCGLAPELVLGEYRKE